jgi:acetyl-CoA carboxylase biotin carboxyl carrier protein
MKRHDLSEIDLQEGDQRIRLRRGGRVVSDSRSVPAGPPPSASEPTPSPVVVPAAAPAKRLLDIKSEAVGVFYAQREPGAPPFVALGSRVNPATVVCIIEAMKVYNDIQAGCSGVIAEILVKDKEFVEFGTVLFRVDPTG